MEVILTIIIYNLIIEALKNSFNHEICSTLEITYFFKCSIGESYKILYYEL